MAVPHTFERWSTEIDLFFEYATKPLAAIWRFVKPAIARMGASRLAPFFARLLAVLRLGTIVKEPDEETTWRARVLWEEAARRGIAMEEFRPFGLSRELFWATYESEVCSFDGLPRPRFAHEAALMWMDDKGVLLKKLGGAHIPVPRGRSCRTLREAEKTFAELVKPVITKPSIGSRSRHTYVDIKDVESLRKAFLKGKELCPFVVVQEQLPGFVFRVTLINGNIAGVIRREPPHVIGDGKHTVRELIMTENKNPLRHGPIFHELSLDEVAVQTLQQQKLSADSVPEKDRMVTIHPKVSRAFGASTTEITEIHPKNVELFLRIGKVIDDPLIGIDFMMSDMKAPWQEQKCGVIECNSLPFIDLHHYPLKGPARNVAGMLWDIIFPESSPTPTSTSVQPEERPNHPKN